MKILFMTQGSTLRLFNDLAEHLISLGEINEFGLYITDSKFFNDYSSAHSGFKDSCVGILKEWEILKSAATIKPDLSKINDIETRLGDPTLWNSIIADRRLSFGVHSTNKQDYQSKYSHDELIAIVQECASALESLFDSLKPDLVVGFICVTIGEYLAYLIAKSRNIPILNLRPTRIQNFFYGCETIHEPSKYLETQYNQFLDSETPNQHNELISNILDDARAGQTLYEGVIPIEVQTNKVFSKLTSLPRPKGPGEIFNIFRDIWRYNYGKYRHDNHYLGYFAPHWHKKIKRPFRVWNTNRLLREKYIIEPNELDNINYVFYPMHKEPEVTLLVYGRPFLNQIEVIRNIARSIPIGMKLVVKEHPMSIGYRPLSYYNKLLDIPNVMLANPSMTSSDLLARTKLVTIVGGSIGLEAMMQKIPVIHFGDVPFSFLPDTMIQGIKRPSEIAIQINDLLKKHKHDESAIRAYIAAVIHSSVPIDFYSVLIGRQGGWRPSVSKENDYQIQLDRLARYILDQGKEFDVTQP